MFQYRLARTCVLGHALGGFNYTLQLFVDLILRSMIQNSQVFGQILLKPVIGLPVRTKGERTKHTIEVFLKHNWHSKTMS